MTEVEKLYAYSDALDLLKSTVRRLSDLECDYVIEKVMDDVADVVEFLEPIHNRQDKIVGGQL